MTEDLQAILDKIQQDGIEKAEEKADEIISTARAEANNLVQQAKKEAASLVENAKSEADAFEKRAAESIRQSARNTVMKVENALQQMFDKVLLEQINQQMSDNTIMAEIMRTVINHYIEENPEPLTIKATTRVIELLRHELQGKMSDKGVEIVIDQNSGRGFSITMDKGRIEHTFTSKAIADTIATMLRPQLAELMQS